MSVEQLGPYRILEQLGRGGMGTVYKAVHLETGEPAAVKLLSTALSDEEGFRQRFEGEVETLRKLRHPNIVRLFGFGEEEGNLFYAMELVDGRSLEEELLDGRWFDWEEVTDIAVQTCRALRHAHDRGIIHRDIKPANIMQTPDGEVKLSDFGIARLFGNTRMTSAGNVMGTAEYMSPEQARAAAVDGRSDLYSLACVMYVLLTRRQVFRADSLMEVLRKQCEEKPEPIAAHTLKCPEQLEEIVMQLLEKDPAKRIPNPSVLARLLEATEHALKEELVEDIDGDTDLQDDVRQAGPASTVVSANPKEGEPIHDGAIHDGPIHDGEVPETREEPVGEDGQVEDGKSNDGGEFGDVSVSQLIREGEQEVNRTKETDAFEREAEEAAARERASRFTFVSEDELDRPVEESERNPLISVQTWVLAGCLVAVALIARYFMTPPSPDTLYDRITEQASSGGVDSLRAVENEIDEFLMRYPSDPRCDEIQEFANEIDLRRLERRFERLARSMATRESLIPIERDYLEAINYVRIDPDRGMMKLQALIALYHNRAESSDRMAECVKLARRRVDQLRHEIERDAAQHLSMINSRLNQADAIRKEDAEQTRAICQAVIDLYEEKPWAKPALDRAREMLQQLAAENAETRAPTEVQ